MKRTRWAVLACFSIYGIVGPAAADTPTSTAAAEVAVAASATAVERLSLQEVIARAQRGPRAQMAKQDTAAARARSGEARAARVAKISITSFLAPSPRIACITPDCTRTDPDDFSFALEGLFGGVNASIVQPLYTFGKLDAVTTAARMAVEATARLEDAVAGDLTLEAGRAYYGLKLARELIFMLDDGLDEIDRALSRIETSLDEGSGEMTVMDKFRIQTLQAEILAQRSEAVQAEGIALAGVRGLVGSDTVDIEEDPLAETAFVLGSESEYLARAEAGRAELAAARAGAKAAAAGERLERAHILPDLALVGSIFVARAQGVENPPTAFAQDPFNTTTGTLALVLRWQIEPLAQRSRIQRAKAKAKAASALVELATAFARFEVRQALAEARGARERVDAARAGDDSSKAWVAAVLQADAVGAVEAKDLADALLARFAMRARLVTSTFHWNVATLRLRRALGEFAAPK